MAQARQKPQCGDPEFDPWGGKIRKWRSVILAWRIGLVRCGVAGQDVLVPSFARSPSLSAVGPSSWASQRRTGGKGASLWHLGTREYPASVIELAWRAQAQSRPRGEYVRTFPARPPPGPRFSFSLLPPIFHRSPPPGRGAGGCPCPWREAPGGRPHAHRQLYPLGRGARRVAGARGGQELS